MNYWRERWFILTLAGSRIQWMSECVSEWTNDWVNEWMCFVLGGHRVHFVPQIVGQLLNVTFVPATELRKATLPMLYDVMECQQQKAGSLCAVSTPRPTQPTTLNGMGCVADWVLICLLSAVQISVLSCTRACIEKLSHFFASSCCGFYILICFITPMHTMQGSLSYEQSVCPFVCLSNAWFLTEHSEHSDILIPCERLMHLVVW